MTMAVSTAREPDNTATGTAAVAVDTTTDSTADSPTSVPMPVKNEDGTTTSGADDAALAPSAVGLPESGAQNLPRLQIFLLMGALCMSVFLAALDTTIITTALPTIAAAFGSSAGFTWVGSAFMLAAAAATAGWGKFSDVWGRKPVLLVANAVFLLGCALCGASATLPMLIAGRAVQGVGAGGLLTLVNIIIGDLFAARDRGKYYGMIGMVWATAGALGPVVGGVLTSKVNWRWCFYINLPISGTAFCIILLFLRLPSPRTPLLVGLRAIDWLGTLTVTGGTLMLLMGLQFGGTEYAWRSATVVCLIVFGIVTLGLFGLIEYAVATYPVMPSHLYANVSNTAVLLVCFFHGLTFIQASYFLPLYFQAVLGATPLLAGVYLLAMSLALALCAASGGAYLKRTGRYKDPIVFGLLLAVLGSGLLLDLPHDRPTGNHAAAAWARIIVFPVVAGAGLGLVFQPPLVALQSNVPRQDNASATASFSLTRNIASALGVVVGSAAFGNRMAAAYDAMRDVIAAAGDDAAAAAAAAHQLAGADAQAGLIIVKMLPAAAQPAVRAAYASALRSVWLQMVGYAAAGLLASVFIKIVTLNRTHVVVQTGIDGERERRRIALAKKAESRGRRKGTAPVAATGDTPAADAV